MSGFYSIDGDYLDDEQIEDMFAEYLDETYDDTVIGDVTFSAGDILREMDPIAFNCAVSDWTSFQVEAGGLFESLEDWEEVYGEEDED